MSLGAQIVASFAGHIPITPRRDAANIGSAYAVFDLIAGSDNAHLAGSGPHRARYQITVFSPVSQYDASTKAASAKLWLQAGMTITGIMDGPDNFDPTAGAYSACFDIYAWET